MSQCEVDPGSFRDPAGQVIHHEGRVFRTVMACALDDFDYVRDCGFMADQIRIGRVIEEKRQDPKELAGLPDGVQRVVEHPRWPFISYPYEWSFSALKAAALLQLDLCLDALRAGVMLSCGRER